MERNSSPTRKLQQTGKQTLQQFGRDSRSIIYATKIIRPLTHFNVPIINKMMKKVDGAKWR